MHTGYIDKKYRSNSRNSNSNNNYRSIGRHHQLNISAIKANGTVIDCAPRAFIYQSDRLLTFPGSESIQQMSPLFIFRRPYQKNNWAPRKPPSTHSRFFTTTATQFSNVHQYSGVSIYLQYSIPSIIAFCYLDTQRKIILIKNPATILYPENYLAHTKLPDRGFLH